MRVHDRMVLYVRLLDANIRLMRNILADKTQLREDERFFLRFRDRAMMFDRFLPLLFTFIEGMEC